MLSRDCTFPASYRSTLLRRSVEWWLLPINPWTWHEQGLTSAVLPLKLSNFVSFAHIICCQGDIIECSWWWGHVIEGKGKKVNTGWKSEPGDKVGWRHNEAHPKGGCRVGLLWSLVEMPVGHKSVYVKLLVWYPQPVFRNPARGLFRMGFLPCRFRLVYYYYYYLFGFIVVFFLACFYSSKLEKDRCSSPRPPTVPGPVQTECVIKSVFLILVL